jgi:hypothetical protein
MSSSSKILKTLLWLFAVWVSSGAQDTALGLFNNLGGKIDIAGGTVIC